MSNRSKLSLSHGESLASIGRPNSEQMEAARHALQTKEAGRSARPHPAQADTPHHGIRANPRPDHPPSGAFDAEGHRPVLERSRKVR